MKPGHRPIVAALAAVPQAAHFWQRPGNTACVSGAATFLADTLNRLPPGAARNAGARGQRLLHPRHDDRTGRVGLSYILTAALRVLVRTLCWHDDAVWTPTSVPGSKCRMSRTTARLVTLRQRIIEHPHAGGKRLLEVPGYKFRALRTNLPPSVSSLEVWRRYTGRAGIETRIKELGTQFVLKDICCRSSWVTEAASHLAICAYNLCVGFPRRLGQPRRAELTTLCCRVFSCVADFSHAAGKLT